MTPAAQMNTSGLPKGELLGRYRTYDDAQKVVDHLAASEGFDIKTITIVGNDLRSVEHIRSRLSYPRVAGAGAAQGAMFGFFIGLLVWLFAPEAPIINMLLSVLLGILIWTLIGVVSYAVRRGKRDFASSSQLTATTFDVVCDFSVAGKARQLVANSGVISLNAWNDPTGRSANLGGASAPGRGAAAPSTAQPNTAQANAPAPDQAAAGAPAQRAGHADLPDGRPRYGVRVQDGETENTNDDGAVPSSDRSPDTQAEAHAVPHDEPPEATEAGSAQRFTPAEDDAERAVPPGESEAEPEQRPTTSEDRA